MSFRVVDRAFRKQPGSRFYSATNPKIWHGMRGIKQASELASTDNHLLNGLTHGMQGMRERGHGVGEEPVSGCGVRRAARTSLLCGPLLHPFSLHRT